MSLLVSYLSCNDLSNFGPIDACSKIPGDKHNVAKFCDLEKRQLSTIHLNAIARIYGDHGEEILELLRKNPAGAIPVVLKRLRQKDVEWRKARAELSKHWKEAQEKNHYKSFDHR
eukprot:gene19853-14445_t